MPTCNVTGIVIRRTPFSETDNILTLYTREQGRISAIAKGARKAISRLSGASELLTCSRMALATGKGMPIVTQVEVKNSFPALRKDLKRLANGLYFAELLGKFIADEQPSEELFVLLRSSLLLLERIRDPEAAARWYELRLMDDLGYAPDLDNCFECGNEIDPAKAEATGGQLALSASHGAVLCTVHASPPGGAFDPLLSGEALAYLRQLAGMGVSDIRQVLAVPTPTEHGAALARTAMRRYIRFRLDRDLKSLDFLDSLE